MSRSWFKCWWRSVLGLFALSSKPRRRTKEERKRTRERRLKNKFSSANLYRTKRKTRHRQSRQSAETGRTLNALLGFIFTSAVCLLLMPLSLLRRAGKRSGGNGSARGYSSGKRASVKRASVKRSKRKRTTGRRDPHKVTAHTAETKSEAIGKTPSPSTPRPTATGAAAKPSATVKPTDAPIAPTPATAYSIPLTDVPETVDENAPKSKPREKGDRYIQKRMLIAGTSCCDPAVLEKLTVGAYIELEAELDDPRDRSAVKLTFKGEKIGYVPKNEQLSYATCLKLKRGVYGVITDVQADASPTKYEFETWFSRP